MFGSNEVKMELLGGHFGVIFRSKSRVRIQFAKFITLFVMKFIYIYTVVVQKLTVQKLTSTSGTHGPRIKCISDSSEDP